MDGGGRGTGVGGDVAHVPRDAERGSALAASVDSLARSECALLALVRSTATAATGREFFRSLVRDLASALGVRMALVGELADGDPGRVRTLAVWSAGGFPEDLAYDLDGTPCEDVVRRGACHFARDVAELFPRDAMLRGMGAVAYLGAPVRDGSGRTRGVLSVVHDAPIPDAEPGLSLLGVLAARAGAELQRMEVEESLRESEARYRALVESATDAIVTLSPAGRFTSMNSACEAMTGHRREDWIDRPFAPLIHRDDLEVAKANFRRALDGVSTAPYELRITTRTRGHVPVEIVAQPLVHGGEVRGVLAVARDVSERRRADAARARLAAAIDATRESVVITDREGVIQFVNPAFERVTGYAADEVIGKNPRVLRSGEHPPEFYAEMWSTILAGRVWSGRIFNRRKDGSALIEDATISPVPDASGAIVNFVAVKRDITREQELERRFLQSQKMEAVGRLAGGIAHDFNNYLTVIGGYAEFLRDRLSDADPSRAGILQIAEAASKAALVTRQLLAFSRRQVRQIRAVDLNDCVRSAERMFRRMIGEDIDLRTDLHAPLPAVMADPGQVDQVLLNLVVNARDAMPGGGRLVISTAPCVLPAADAPALMELPPGEYVRLTVADTGHGMEAHVLDHVFEPFFTTKAPGKGTGLGLATVFGIVRQSGGDIAIRSAPGEGATFDILLPACAEAAAAAAPGAAPSPPAAAGETILVCEDEPAVRDIVVAALEGHGYRVLVAGRGDEALDVAARHTGPVDLLLTDVVMPGMGGRELAERLRARRPDTLVLYMSGYSDDFIAGRGVLADGAPLLQKPFTPDAVLRRVAAALRGG